MHFFCIPKKSLSDDQIQKVNDHILNLGGIVERNPILEIIFYYWVIHLNPSFPRKFLLPSLYLLKNMKKMEAKWARELRKVSYYTTSRFCSHLFIF